MAVVRLHRLVRALLVHRAGDFARDLGVQFRLYDGFHLTSAASDQVLIRRTSVVRIIRFTRSTRLQRLNSANSRNRLRM